MLNKLSIFVSFYCVGVLSVDIPSVIRLCNRDDDKINTCLKKSINYCISHLGGGIQELNLPPLEPYALKDIVFKYDRNQITGQARISYLKVYGITHSVVTNVRSNILDDSFDMEIDMSNPKIFSEGKVKLKARLNALVIDSDTYEYFNTTMTGLTWTLVLKGLPETKGGKIYLRIVEASMSPQINDMKVHLDPLFGNDVETNRLSMRFANEFWRDIYKELLVLIEQLWSNAAIRLSKKIFRKIPYYELFP